MARLPNTAIVLQPTNSPIVTLDLCLQLGGTSGNVWRKSMAREEKEVASRTIERLRILIAQIDGEKGGKRTSREKLLESCQSIEVLGVLSKDGESLSERVGNVNINEEELVELDTSVPNSIFWKNARRIIIGPTIVTVKYNVPTITAVTPPSSLYVGVPAVCGSIAALFTTEADVQYEWCSRGPCTSLSEKGVGSAAVRVISTSPVLIPTEKELGESLFLRVLPQPGSDLCTIVDLPTVQLEFPSMDRWKHTTKPATAPVFRVVTYNILHDEFCTSGSAKKTIYPFATDDILALEYRQARIVQELIAYKADIVCLQECGKKVYQRFLSRVMLHLGYEGCYSNKNGGVQEGCACFWRSSRFALEEKSEFPLNWSTLETDHPQLAADVSKHEEFKEALRNVTSIGVMLQLKDRITNEKLLVGNTHLFYHANACHIRLLQAFMLLSRLQQMAHSHTAVVLCGDFNFTHTTGGYRLVTTGCVESGHHSGQRVKCIIGDVIACWVTMLKKERV
uniref:Endonuclease/exonuclease/phosphatase domain-containing protein n=1 Tax=Trypanosoma congolense (strain IL3000) TaxID=1068625 RepID=G0UL82_TRYCI|nr:conserved hypothetical protein [Trypanosoma congolense IL3000]